MGQQRLSAAGENTDTLPGGEAASLPEYVPTLLLCLLGMCLAMAAPAVCPGQGKQVASGQQGRRGCRGRAILEKLLIDCKEMAAG